MNSRIISTCLILKHFICKKNEKQSLNICLPILMFFHATGSQDGKIHAWNVESGLKVAVMESKHDENPVYCVQYNPKFMMLASSSLHMVGSQVLGQKRKCVPVLFSWALQQSNECLYKTHFQLVSGKSV